MLVILLYSKKIFRENKRNIPNPFINMIYHPDICKLYKCHNKYFKCSLEEVSQLNLSEFQIKLLMNRKTIDGKVYFMVYDLYFITFFGELGNSPSNSIKHLTWLFYNIIIYYLCVI